MIPRLLALALCFMLASTVTASAQSAIVLGDHVASKVGIEQVATGLAFPMGMTVLPDGSLLVSTSPSDQGNFYASAGELLRLADSDGDGSLDQQTALASGLPGSLVAVTRFGEIVIATSAQNGNEQIMFFRRGEHWRDPLTEVTAITLAFNGSEHQSYGLAVQPHQGDKTAFDLFFNVGSRGNAIVGPDIQTGGAVTSSLRAASVYMVTVTDAGADLAFGDPVLVATGLRNGTTLALQPGSGDLWIGENGIDGLVDPTVSFSADELDVVPAESIGSDVLDFGFPDRYINYATGNPVGDETDRVNFLPIDGSESEGVAGIAFVPMSFGGPLAGGILAGFHGQFDETGIENEENPLLWIDPATGKKFDLVSNESPGVGHLDSITAGEGVVYIADFCDGSMAAATEGCGVIYTLRPARSEEATPVD